MAIAEDSLTALARLDRAIEKGLADAEAGRTLPAAEVFARLERKYLDLSTPPD